MRPEARKPLLDPVNRSGESPPQSPKLLKKAASLLSLFRREEAKPLIIHHAVEPLVAQPTIKRNEPLSVQHDEQEATRIHPSSIEIKINNAPTIASPSTDFLSLLDQPKDNLQEADTRRLLEYILDNPEKINEVNGCESSPLILAIQNRHIEIAIFLILRGADLDQACNKGYTPLLIASQEGNTEIARLLIQKGADKDKACNAGRTPLLIALQKGDTEIIRLIQHADKILDEQRENNLLE